MKHGQIAGNRSINALIYRCFEYISGEDEQKFVSSFREQPHDSRQIMHTFRELVLGAYLAANGLSVRYELPTEGLSPDWTILGTDSASIRGILELTNFHIDRATDLETEEQVRSAGLAAYWRDKNQNNTERLYQSIWEKARKYKPLVQRLKVPYVVALFADFKAMLDFEEVKQCLFGSDSGIFGICPELSGVLYFEESAGRYSFQYAGNPGALRQMDMPDGTFPPKLSLAGHAGSQTQS
jgi:hypothetical protein